MTSMALVGVGLARASEFSTETVALAVVDLLPADPIPQRLGVHPSRLETLVLSGPEVQLPITLLVAVSITDTLSRST
jgi:hypothetical protein